MECYCALHERQLGERGEVERTKDSEILVRLPNGLPFLFSVDKRDKRVLVIFDGFLVAGSLPRNAQIVSEREVEVLSVNIKNIRKLTYGLKPNYVNFGKETEVSLKRYGVLLPVKCKTIFYRFRPKSLAPQGVWLKIENGVAVFETITY